VRAAVYRGPGRLRYEEVPDPVLQVDTDALVRVDTVSICSVDRRIVAGALPAVAPGTVLGHEAIGTVVQVGAAVASPRRGQRVLVSCTTSCGLCPACRRGFASRCRAGGGWVLGHRSHGTQADLVRVPFAATSTTCVPEGLADEEVLMLADVVPTAYEIGVRGTHVEPGDVVVVVGAGPLGLAVLAAARLLSPSLLVAVDLDVCRRRAAETLGAAVTVDPRTEDPAAVVRAHGDGLGADVAVDTAGTPETFETCLRIVRAGGRVATTTVHPRPATVHLERLWSRDVTITTGLVDGSSTARLVELLRSGALDLRPLTTHRLPLERIEEAYRLLDDLARTHVLKVVLTAW
jgi:alcohol dehydrogenase